METIYFKQKDFNKLDWSKLKKGKYPTNGENYSLAKGGNGYRGGRGWLIVIYVNDDLTEEWELPTLLSDIIDWNNKQGKDEKLREIQHLLGIK